MTLSIAYLGPQGTYSEQAALAYRDWLAPQGAGDAVELRAYPSILQTIRAVAAAEVDLAIAPVENSIEGSVTVTLDALWQFETLRIQQTLILPIIHSLITYAPDLAAIEMVYSHPQALGQCQGWLLRQCPRAKQIPTRSTTEALEHLESAPTTAAIASQWAAELYQLPTLAIAINDQPDNCTKFWVLGTTEHNVGQYTSLAFSLPVNAPGALLKPLQILATEGINLSRIESRPTKRSLGEYLFFIDVEASATDPRLQTGLQALMTCTETIKVFGSYSAIPITPGPKAEP